MNEEHFNQRIREALQEDASPEQLARLEAFWAIESQFDRRRRTVRRVLALAASVLVASVVVGSIARQWFGGVQLVQAPIPIVEIVPQPIVPAPELPQVVVSETQSPLIGRKPTAMEQFVFYSQTHPNRGAANETLVAIVDDMIHQVSSGEIAPQQAVDDTRIAMAGIEHELLRRLVRSKDDDKRVLLRLLAVSGSAKSIPTLLRLSRRAALREEAMATIEQIVGLEGLAEVVRQSSDGGVRKLLMQRMLTSESDGVLGAYLSLVQDSAFRAEALAAADGVPKVPTQAFFSILRRGGEGERLAAAIVLGHLNGPEITHELVALVMSEESAPTEAWLALLSCRGELAQEFLNYASQRPQLLGQVNHARVQWARMKL